MRTKKRATILTLLISILNSGAVIIFNLVYNNLVMKNYGSDINGLISTLSQFVSMFSIIEGGFMTAAVVAIYEPYLEKDYKKLNDILYTVKKFYIKIGSIITAAVLISGTIYIKFIDSPYTYTRTFSFLVVTVMATSISLCFQSKYSVLIQGANYEYIQVNINLITKTVTWIVSVMMLLNNVDILLIYSINIVNIILNVLAMRYYEKKTFAYVTYKGEYDKKTIKGTGDVLFQKIANTIFTTTDLVLISSGVGLATASVYNLYQQIFRSVFGVLASVVQAPFHSLGHLYEEGNEEKVNYYFKIYFKVTLLASSILLVTTGSLILNFISIYTAKIIDINYVRDELAILFFLQYYAQIINRPFGTILNISGNFAKQNVQCGIAAAVNLIASVLLMQWLGIAGVIIGSILGTSVILVMNIIQSRTIIDGIKRMTFEIGMNLIACLILIFLSIQIGNIAHNFMQWIILAIVIALLDGIIMYLLNLLLDYKWMMGFSKQLVNKCFERLRKKSN